jgi:uncharacterized protein YbaA (DUF1428 family)
MNESNATDIEEEFGSQIGLVVGRMPKKNLDAAMQIAKQSKEILRRHGMLRSEVFQLDNTDSYEDMGLTNIAKIVSANPGEEVWVEIQFYRDRRHMDDVRTKCRSDENMGRLYKQSLDLLVPGTCFIIGDFSRLIV